MSHAKTLGCVPLNPGYLIWILLNGVLQAPQDPGIGLHPPKKAWASDFLSNLLQGLGWISPLREGPEIIVFLVLGSKNNNESVHQWKFCSRKIIRTVYGRTPANHLKCMNPWKIMGKLPYQLVQDFFHQQYGIINKQSIVKMSFQHHR